MKMEMKIQETIFNENERNIIYSWNHPHATFPIIVPLLRLDAYGYSVLKGLCTSTGGLSESIIKFSLQELGSYLTYVFEGREHLMHKLMKEVLQLMK